jgi:hypothetical protein
LTNRTIMPARIVTSTYRYKRPPRKRKAVPLQGPAIVRKGAAQPASQKLSAEATFIPPPTEPANDDRKSGIVTAKRRRSRFGEVPDMTLEEHQRRGDAADALFHKMARLATE